MEFFNSAVDTLQKVVIILGAAIGVWGLINLSEGYSNDNPAARSQGIKQFMGGVGIVLVALQLIPQLKNFFS